MTVAPGLINRGGGYGRSRALLVDYGGVLTTSLAVSFGAFCVDSGVSPERLKAVLGGAYTAAQGAPASTGDLHDLLQAVETGRLEPAEFDRRLAEALSLGLPEPLEPTGLTARLLAKVGPDEKMRATVRRARELGVATGLISNTWGQTPPDEVDGMFDTIVLSGVAGVRKPDPEIYLLAARRLGVSPTSCVFVDDLPINVEGARVVGMTAVLHKDAAITIPMLEQALGIGLAGA